MSNEVVGMNNQIPIFDLKQSPFASVHKSRGTNFTTQDLEHLCAAWVQVSENPDCKGDLWNQVQIHFNENVDQEKHRSAKSLAVKFGDISRACVKFDGYYQSVILLNEKGKTEQEWIRQALSIFLADNKLKTFPLLGCWKILRRFPNWTSAAGGSKRRTGFEEGASRKRKKEKVKPNIHKKELQSAYQQLTAALARRAKCMDECNEITMFMNNLNSGTAQNYFKLKRLQILKKYRKKHEVEIESIFKAEILKQKLQDGDEIEILERTI